MSETATQRGLGETSAALATPASSASASPAAALPVARLASVRGAVMASP